MADYTIPTSPLKRLRYYNNQFLTEKDFIDDQAAHLAHERAQLRALCAPGVWEGLAINYTAVPTTSAPTVGVGIAVDAQGRLIVLDPAATGPAPSTLANGDYLLSIQYNELASDMSTNTGGSAGMADNTRFTSLPVLSATVSGAVPAGAIVLGGFSVTGGQITAHSDAGRQYAGLRLPGPALPGNPPPPAATLTNRNDGSADGAQLTGTLTVQKTSAAAIGPSLTLANPNAAPGGANAGGAIDFHSYDPGANAPGVRIQSLGDANFSSHLSISTKAPGAIGNALVERLRIASSGAATFNGAVTATGPLTVQKTSPSAVGPSLTLANPNAPPGGANAGGAIDFNSYDPGANAPGVRIQSLGDGNFSSHLSISMKTPGAIGNALVERLRITSNGAANFTGAVSAQSLSVPTYNGAVAFTGAVRFNGAVTTVAQLLPIAPAETNMLPLIVNRDYLGHNHSLIDHNGYRMGEVSEIDENWKLAGTRTVVFSAVPVDFGGGDSVQGAGTKSSGGFYQINQPGVQADTVIGPVPASATITSLVVNYGRDDGAIDFSLNRHSFITASFITHDILTIVKKTISTGTGSAVTDLAVSPTSGGLPYTVRAETNLTLNVVGSSPVGNVFVEVFGFLLTYIMDPPGWTWTPPDLNLFATDEFNCCAMRRYQDPTAALGLNQRSVNIASPSNAVFIPKLAPVAEGSLTTEGYEALMDANICYVQEWMCRTGTISDTVNARSFKLGVQNANAGANDRFIYFFNQNTTATWQLRVVGSTIGDTDTKVAIAANTIYRMRLEILGGNMSSAGANAFRIRGFINGKNVAEVVSDTLPTADMIRPFFAAGVTATGTGGYDFSVGRVRRVWNHLQSPDGL